MKRILGILALALALGGALVVALPADPAEANNRVSRNGNVEVSGSTSGTQTRQAQKDGD